MTDKVQKIREEVVEIVNSINLFIPDEDGKNSNYEAGKLDAATQILQIIDSLKESVSEELEETSRNYADNEEYGDDMYFAIKATFEAGAKWQNNHLWKPADGDDLPIIDREVIALLDNGKVVFAHRPPEYWDGKDIVTGKVTRNYPKTYGKGGWNIPNIKYWLDVELPKEIEP